MSRPPTFRFAPSPNGELHLGHAYSALLNWEMARASGGRFLLRIEDIDPGRTREPHVAQILEDLAWLGLVWEEPVRRQSEHFDDYRRAADQLRARGLLYPCFATRRGIAEAAREERDPDGSPLYPGLWRDAAADAVQARLEAGKAPAWRIDMAKALAQVAGADLGYEAFTEEGSAEWREARPERWGDAVIVRRDTPASYHLAVVVDDALQGVTHVVRGKDLEAATDLHRLLQVLLGLPAPRYHHHALLTDPAGRKLAKSLKDRSLASMRREGVTAAGIRGRFDLRRSFTIG